MVEITEAKDASAADETKAAETPAAPEAPAGPEFSPKMFVVPALMMGTKYLKIDLNE